VNDGNWVDGAGRIVQPHSSFFNHFSGK
jgi:hypothetical protein